MRTSTMYGLQADLEYGCFPLSQLKIEGSFDVYGKRWEFWLALEGVDCTFLNNN